MSKERVDKLAFFDVAAVWFGTHAGGGFATGNQTKNFFLVGGGWNCLWMPFISILIVALVHRAAMINAVEHDTYEYRSWSKALYGNQIMPILFEICYLLVAVCGVCASIAGGASVFETYGLSYTLGIIVFGLVFILLSIFGSGLIRKASSVMTIIMAVLMLLIFIIGISSNTTELAQNVAAHETASVGSTILSLLQYAGFQAAVTVVVFSTCQPLKRPNHDYKEIDKSTIVGYIINISMLYLSVVMLFAWNNEIGSSSLPTLDIIIHLGNKYAWLQVCYIIVLVTAFISTGVTLTFGLVARFENIVKISPNLTVVRGILSAFVIIVCMVVSTAGLDNIVMKGYGFVGVAAVPVIIIPLLWKIRKKRFIQNS